VQTGRSSRQRFLVVIAHPTDWTEWPHMALNEADTFSGNRISFNKLWVFLPFRSRSYKKKLYLSPDEREHDYPINLKTHKIHSIVFVPGVVDLEAAINI